MQISTFFVAVAANFATTAHAVDEFSTTATAPGLTLTLPIGIDETTTSTIPPAVITGEAAIISGVTIVVNAESVFFIDGNNFVLGNAQGTNEYNGITVVDGSIPGATGAGPMSNTENMATPTESNTSGSGGSSSSGQGTITSTTMMGPTDTTMTTTTTTDRPNAGARDFGSAGRMLGWAGVAVGAAAVANY